MMVDAGPSLFAAEGLPASALATYLRSAGWSLRPSRVEGVSILSHWDRVRVASSSVRLRRAGSSWLPLNWGLM